MVLQPAAGARDLNPGEVDANRRIGDLLASVYRLWGYQEVAPPAFEHLETLEAGGAIAARELVRLVAGEPLGLRPELTASIARTAGTRLADRPRPLRLWACGSTFRSHLGEAGSLRIEERLQSGVELLGERSSAAEAELLHLLLAATSSLGLDSRHAPTLLVGHHGLLDALLDQLAGEQRKAVREALTSFNPLDLTSLPLSDQQHAALRELSGLRGRPVAVLQRLEGWLGQDPLLERLAAVLASVAPTAARLGLRLQLDPSFQPHFDLYDGLVFKLVCRGSDAPVAIASGGRYDGLVARFCSDNAVAAGSGFAFDVEAIRELLSQQRPAVERGGPWLVAAAGPQQLAAQLQKLADLHAAGEAAELWPTACASQQQAEAIASERGCRGAIWLAG